MKNTENALYGKNVEFFEVTFGGAYGSHWVLKILRSIQNAENALYGKNVEFLEVSPGVRTVATGF